jgi:hypothetical protein
MWSLLLIYTLFIYYKFLGIDHELYTSVVFYFSFEFMVFQILTHFCFK